MDTEYYRSLAYKQLNEATFYSEIPENIDKRIMLQLNRLLNRYSECFTEKERDYLTNFEYHTCNFYGLPKFHKSGIIQEAVKDQNNEYVVLDQL